VWAETVPLDTVRVVSVWPKTVRVETTYVGLVDVRHDPVWLDSVVELTTNRDAEARQAVAHSGDAELVVEYESVISSQRTKKYDGCQGARSAEVGLEDGWEGSLVSVAERAASRRALTWLPIDVAIVQKVLQKWTGSRSGSDNR
ncbi:hypothetical protein FOZ63_003361, partial [Perkinsus olseni]